MKYLDDALDLVLLVIVLVTGLAFTITCTNLINKVEITPLSEKTAMVSQSEVVVPEVRYTNTDLMMMLVVSDKYQPQPREMSIVARNGTTLHTITFDDNWFANKEAVINTLYQQTFKNYLTAGVSAHTLTYDNGGNLQWRIQYN